MADEYIGITSTDGMSTIALGVLGSWFSIPDLSPLWDLADDVNVDADLPATDGKKPYPRFRTSVEVSVGFEMFGDLTRGNDPVADTISAREQLWDHRQYLAANVCGRSDAADGTRTITLHLPNGATVDATGHVGRRLYLAEASPISVEGTLRITLHDGEMGDTGS